MDGLVLILLIAVAGAVGAYLYEQRKANRERADRLAWYAYLMWATSDDEKACRWEEYEEYSKKVKWT